MWRGPDRAPALFTHGFILAALANSLLNFAAFLFVHFPGFLQQLGAGEAQIGRIMAAQAALAFFVAVVALFAFMKTFVITTGTSSVGAFFGAYAIVAVALRTVAGRVPERLGTVDWLALLMAGPVVGLAIERMGYRAAFVGLALLLVIGMICFYGLDRDFTTGEESGRTVETS
jgi:hypothetical protein